MTNIDEPKAEIVRRRVILATAPHGHGHFSAAEALAQAIYFVDPATNVEVVNVYDWLRKPWQRVLTVSWEAASTWSPFRATYGTMYRSLGPRDSAARLLHQVFNAPAQRCATTICQEPLSHFVALHPAAVPFGVHAKARSGCALSVVATDYVLHSLHCHEAVDRYFAGPRSAFIGNLALGVRAAGRVTNLGPPLADCYWQSNCESSHLCERPRVVVSFGGRGYRGRQCLALISNVIRNSNPRTHFDVVAGRNPSLQTALAEMQRSLGPDGAKVTIHGFVRDLASLLRGATLLIGKAGGITLTEAFSFGVPVAIVDTLPGQEDFNSAMVVEAGAGIRTDSAEKVLEYLQTLSTVVGKAATRARVLALSTPTATVDMARQLLAA